MTTLQEACVTALDSLEQWAALIKHQYTGTSEGMTDLQRADNAGMMAIEALKSALAQQGEPVAWTLQSELEFLATGRASATMFSFTEPDQTFIPLYTAAPAPQAQPVAQQVERTARDAFESFAKQYDTFGNKWQDMGADDYFIAGYKAAMQSTQPAQRELSDEEIADCIPDTADILFAKNPAKFIKEFAHAILKKARGE